MTTHFKYSYSNLTNLTYVIVRMQKKHSSFPFSVNVHFKTIPFWLFWRSLRGTDLAVWALHVLKNVPARVKLRLRPILVSLQVELHWNRIQFDIDDKKKDFPAKKVTVQFSCNFLARNFCRKMAAWYEDLTDASLLNVSVIRKPEHLDQYSKPGANLWSKSSEENSTYLIFYELNWKFSLCFWLSVCFLSSWENRCSTLSHDIDPLTAPFGGKFTEPDRTYL